jgi:transposase
MGEGTFVGLDVHARSVVAGVICERTGQVRVQRVPHALDDLVSWIRGLEGPVRVAYEAGPTGYGLARACEAAGIACTVAAPSHIARSPAARQSKRDQSDAENLARLLRRGELVSVRVPDALDEAARDLVRARDDARADLMRTRHRLSKFLLRHGHVYEARTWTLVHEDWIRSRRGAVGGPVADAVLDAYYGAMIEVRARRDHLDELIAICAKEPRWSALVARLECLRGISTLTAFSLAVDIGDWRRLSGAAMGPYLGLVPCESQSGQRRTRGPITKAGNGHLRRLMVEAAWHQRTPPRPSTVLARRRARCRPEVIARAEAAQVRLHRRWAHLHTRRGLRSTVVATAVARELAGWCWSLAVMED